MSSEYADIDPDKYAGGLSPVAGKADCAKPREKRCPECRSRVTVGTDGTTEYGHEYGCPNRPANLPQCGDAYNRREHIPSGSGEAGDGG